MPPIEVPRLTRGEYWILNSLVEFEFRFFRFAYEGRDLEEAFNRTSHGLAREQLVDVLLSLLDRQWIQARVERNDDSLLHIGRLTRAELEAALDDKVQRKTIGERFTWCGLTKLGGSVWESFAAPKWDRFVCCLSGGELELEFSGPTEWRVEKYFSYARVLGYDVIPGSERCDTIEPWQATYWKQLPRAHRIRCVLASPDLLEVDPREPFPAEVSRLQRWYDWS